MHELCNCGGWCDVCVAEFEGELELFEDDPDDPHWVQTWQNERILRLARERRDREEETPRVIDLRETRVRAALCEPVRTFELPPAADGALADEAPY